MFGGGTLWGNIVQVHWEGAELCTQDDSVETTSSSSESPRQTLGWSTLELRRWNALPCQVPRCLTNKAPSYLCFKFISNSSLHCAETRGSAELRICTYCILDLITDYKGTVKIANRFASYCDSLHQYNFVCHIIGYGSVAELILDVVMNMNKASKVLKVGNSSMKHLSRRAHHQ